MRVNSLFLIIHYYINKIEYFIKNKSNKLNKNKLFLLILVLNIRYNLSKYINL